MIYVGVTATPNPPKPFCSRSPQALLHHAIAIAMGFAFLLLSLSAAFKLPPPHQQHQQPQPAWELPVLIYQLQHQISTLPLSFLVLLGSIKKQGGERLTTTTTTKKSPSKLTLQLRFYTHRSQEVQSYGSPSSCNSGTLHIYIKTLKLAP